MLLCYLLCIIAQQSVMLKDTLQLSAMPTAMLYMQIQTIALCYRSWLVAQYGML